MKYDCSICGKNHEIYFGIKMGMSQKLSKIIEENSDSVIESEGVYMIDKSIIVISAQISIPTGYGEDFFYQTWVKCDAKHFIKFSEEYKNENGGKLNCALYDALIPFFPETENLKCIIVYEKNMKSSDKPSIQIIEKSELKNWQNNGLSKIELIKLMNRVHHNKINKSSK